MHLDYGPIAIYNDDRTLPESERETFRGWYFQPWIDGSTIALFEDEQVVMYVQIDNPLQPTEHESWTCSATFHQDDTTYIGYIYNYAYGSLDLTNAAAERDEATPAD